MNPPPLGWERIMGAIEKKEDANCCGTTCKMMMMMIMATLLDVILLVRIAITVASLGSVACRQQTGL